MFICKIKIITLLTNSFSVSFQVCLWRQIDERKESYFDIEEKIIYYVYLPNTNPFPFYILDDNISNFTCGGAGLIMPKSFAVDPKLLYHCRKCGKAYETRYSCVRHENTLCGIEPRFRCVYCEFRTKYKYNLKVHYQYKHKGEMERLETTAKMCNLMSSSAVDTTTQQGAMIGWQYFTEFITMMNGSHF